MKITKEQLKEIIKEEIEALSEGTRFRAGPRGEALPFRASTEEMQENALRDAKGALATIENYLNSLPDQSAELEE